MKAAIADRHIQLVMDLQSMVWAVVTTLLVPPDVFLDAMMETKGCLGRGAARKVSDCK